MKKRIVYFMVAVMVAVTASATVYGKTFSVDVLDEVLGDNSRNGFSAEVSTFPYYDSERAKNVLEISGRGQVNIDLPEPIWYGESFLMEFDIKALGDQSNLRMELVDTERSVSGAIASLNEKDTTNTTYAFCADAQKGVIAMYDKPKYGTLPTDHRAAEYVKDKWYNVKIFFDKYLGTMNLFVDDKFMDNRGDASYDSSIGQLLADKLYIIRLYANNDNDGTLLDNVSVKWLDYNNSQEYKDLLDIADMSRCHRGIDAYTDLGPLGNIFTDKDMQQAELKLKNRTDAPFEGTLRMEAINSENNKVLFTDETPISLGIGTSEERETVVNADLKTGRYGLFNLRLTVLDKKGKVFCTQLIPYSVVNAPEKGVKNPRLGFTFHHARHTVGSIENLHNEMELVDLLGVGYLRSSHFGYSTDGYVEIYDDFDKAFIDDMIKYKIPELMPTIFNPQSVRETLVANPNLTSEYVLSEIEEYAYRFAKEIEKDAANEPNFPKVRYSVYNEPNYERVSAESYGKFLKAFYDGIKRADSNNEVYGFCLGGFELSYIQKAFEQYEDGEIPCDGVAIHPYTSDTPDAQEYAKRALEVKAGVQAYKQLENSKFYADEVGFSGEHKGEPLQIRHRDVSEKEQADFNIRRQVLDAFYQIFDGTGLYTFIDYTKSKSATTFGSQSHSERSFGVIHAAWEEEVPYSAKPAYVALAYFNRLMTGAKPIKDFSANSGQDLGFLFDTKGEGNTLVLYNTVGRKYANASGSVSIKIDEPSLTLCDIYGNESEIYPINGIYTIGTDERPVYIRGRIDDVEVVDTQISLDNPTVGIVDGDVGILRISNTTGKKVEFDTYTIGDIKTEVKNVSDTQTEIRVISEGNPNEEDGVYITGICDGKKVYEGFIRVEYIDTINPYFTVVPKDSEGKNWVGTLGIANRCLEKAIDCDVKITSPNILKDKIGNIKLTGIKPEEAKSYQFNIPVEYAGASMKIEAEIVINNEKTVQYSASSDCRTSNYAHRKPVIDGKLDEGEWDTMPLYINRDDQMFKLVEESDWRTGPEDLTAVGYLMWDEENMYFAADVTDDDFYVYSDDDNNIWRGDSIQFGVANTKSDSSFTEVAVGRIGDKDTIKFFSSTIPNIALGDLQGSECKITRDGTKTIYEVKIPWTKMVPDASKIKEFSSFVFSYLVNDGDDRLREDIKQKLLANGHDAPYRYGYGEYYVDPVRGGGIGSAKDPDLFLEFTLLK